MTLSIYETPAVTKVVTVTPAKLTMREGTLTFNVHQDGDYNVVMGDILLYNNNVRNLDRFHAGDYGPDRNVLSLLCSKDLADFFYKYVEARMGFMPADRKVVMMVKAIRSTVVVVDYNEEDDCPF